ncbi:MAG: flagellar basal body P-ring protein FlgI, partial [Planctomycetota bacterium]
MIINRSLKFLCLLVLFLLPAGCDPSLWGKEEPLTRPAGTIDDGSPILDRSLALKGTVGEFTYVRGLRGMQVRGVGLVRGLSGKGSTSCPESIRKDLISEIRKLYLANPDAEPTLTPEQLIDSRNTAAVMVEAVIPFGMSKGERFDVLVRAVDQETRFVSG